MNNNELLIIAIAFIIGFAVLKLIIRLLDSKIPNSSEQHYEEDKEFYNYAREKKDDFSELQWWDILGVDRNSSLDEIQNSYKRLISKYHPDKFSTLSDDFNELANKKAQLINHAYERALSDRTQ